MFDLIFVPFVYLTGFSHRTSLGVRNLGPGSKLLTGDPESERERGQGLCSYRAVEGRSRQTAARGCSSRTVRWAGSLSSQGAGAVLRSASRFPSLLPSVVLSLGQSQLFTASVWSYSEDKGNRKG